jgi:predicted dehydrogenase/threonine dehydrogenase-like Zn-dependent dehydrogenase
MRRPPIPPWVKQRLPEWQLKAASRMGLTGPMARDAQREVMWWAYARVLAAQNRRPLYRGVCLGWTSTGYTELLPVEVPHPGRGRVTVLTEASVVSRGTERARYLRLPNASFGLGMPGYSSAGTVVAAGPGVEGIGEGDRVAVDGGAHGSLANAPAAKVYPVPDGVAMADAALIKLAVIAGHGLRAGRVAPEDGVVVVGAGPIGLLAQRLAAAAGASPAAVIARSTAREQLALAGGAGHFLVAGRDAEEIEALGAPVVIEAAGDPEAIHVAVAAAGEGGRVVLLGSPRGVTRRLPLDEIRAKRLELIGAHVSRQDAAEERDCGEAFVRALGDGSLTVSDLVGPPIDPREAGLFYRELARDGGATGAYFDWTGLPESERIGRGRLARLPSIAGRGADMNARPLPAPRRPRRLADDVGLDDPFRGAAGMLRVGMLGCGDIAGANAAALGAAPNARLVAAFDPVERLARDIAARSGAEVAASSDALIENPAVDAVLLSVPHHLHAPLALQAIAAGKHVVVEKPLANDLASAVEMTEAAERAGVVLSVAFAYRYKPESLVARWLMDHGAVGEVGGFFVRSIVDKTPAYWLGGYSGRSPSDWRRSREKAGGGILIMNLTHYVDLCRHLTGLEPDELWSLHSVTDEQMEVEDSVSVSVRWTGGAHGTFTGYSAARGAWNEEVRIWGRDGHVAVEPDARVFTLRAIDGFRTARWQRFGLSAQGTMRARYLSRLATAIHEDRAPDVTAADGLAVQAFVEAAYRSGEKGHGVRPGELLAEARGGVRLAENAR